MEVLKKSHQVKQMVSALKFKVSSFEYERFEKEVALNVLCTRFSKKQYDGYKKSRPSLF